MRHALALLMFLLPRRFRRVLARRLLGWDVDPTAHIGRSIILAQHVYLGPNASIGSFNVIRGLRELRLDEGASIATRNFISAVPLAASGVFTHSPDQDPSLILRAGAGISVGHEIDCSDRVELGEHAALAGFRSQILTHNLDLVRDRLVTAPVVLGDRCFVMSGCIIMCGTQVPPRSIVSAGSVVNTKLTAEGTFYRGNPAEAVRELPESLRLFQREGTQAQIAESLESLHKSRRGQHNPVSRWRR